MMKTENDGELGLKSETYLYASVPVGQPESSPKLLFAKRTQCCSIKMAFLKNKPNNEPNKTQISIHPIKESWHLANALPRMVAIYRRYCALASQGTRFSPER